MMIVVFELMMMLMATWLGHFETNSTTLLFSGFDRWGSLLGGGRAVKLCSVISPEIKAHTTCTFF